LKKSRPSTLNIVKKSHDNTTMTTQTHRTTPDKPRTGAAPGNKFAQKGEQPKEAYIHMRVTPAFKSACVRAAEGQKLTDWVTDKLKPHIDQ